MWAGKLKKNKTSYIHFFSVAYFRFLGPFVQTSLPCDPQSTS